MRSGSQERSEAAAWRKLNSLTAPRTAGTDLRIGDCRVVLSDIEDNSVALILTDPPYGNDAIIVREIGGSSINLGP